MNEWNQNEIENGIKSFKFDSLAFFPRNDSIKNLFFIIFQLLAFYLILAAQKMGHVPYW
jgi:hypothetical protein